jgi:hypothetical protein
MDYEHYFKNIIILACCICLSFEGRASLNHVSLKRAMMNKTISVNAISLGGRLGSKNIKLSLTNNTTRELTVDIDPALIFAPEDTSFQDLVLPGNETIVLAPSANADVKLQAFCGKSYAKGPYLDLKYHFKKQGDSNMIKTLNYVKANNVDVHLAQYAVWTFTNGRCLNTVYSHNNVRMSEDLMKYMAGLRKQKLPEFYSEDEINSTPGRPVCVPGFEKIYVVMHWGSEAGARNMHLTVYKENGEIYKTIEADREIDKYGSTVNVQFDARVDPAGVYLVKLRDDEGKIWGQKKVAVGIRDCDLP